jgi:hypothetical protein
VRRGPGARRVPHRRELARHRRLHQLRPLAEQDDDARSALSRQILDVLTDSYSATRDGDGLTVRALIALRSRGVG